jgi:hypothetical protein
MKSTWIVIANTAHSQLLQREPAHRMTSRQSGELRAARMRSSELGDDKAGCEFSSRARSLLN